MTVSNFNTLVIGAAGFIGSTLCDRLIENGYHILCLDNFDPFYATEIKQNNISRLMASPALTFFKGDINDELILNNIFTQHDIKLVINLAAKAGVRSSLLNPKEFYESNIMGHLNLLESMKKYQVSNLIYASSSSVYGNNKKIPFSEEDAVDSPISPYAASKRSAELMNYTYHSLYKINIINLRFFTVYGPRQRPDLAIHAFFRKLYTDRAISFFGDGSTSRDYTFIEDIITGILSAIKLIHTKTNYFDIINLGNNQPVTLHYLLNSIEQVTNKNFKINREPLPPGDVLTTYADISKAKKLLAYNPSTSLITGLEKFKVWFEENKMYNF